MVKMKQKLNVFKKVLFDNNTERISANELASIIKAKEDGLYQVLPCQIGANVYYIDEDIYGNPKMIPGKVDAYTWFPDNGFCLMAVWSQPIRKYFDFKRHAFPFTSIGQRYFLSLDDALDSKFLKDILINIQDLRPLSKKELLSKVGQMVCVVEDNDIAPHQWGILRKNKEFYDIRTKDEIYCFTENDKVDWKAYQFGYQHKNNKQGAS